MLGGKAVNRTLCAIRPVPRNLWWSIFHRHPAARPGMRMFVAWWRPRARALS